MAPASTPWRVRAAASMLALLITGLGVRALLADIALRTPAAKRPAVIYVEGAHAMRAPEPTILPLSAAAPPAPAPATLRVEAAPRATASTRRSALSRAAVPTPSREPAFSAIAAPRDNAAPAPTPDANANERRQLDLSLDVMRAAARDSKSPVRRMADASGRATGDEPRSRSEVTAASIARAAKPDCLGPNENASLLSVFTVAYAAIREQCR